MLCDGHSLACHVRAKCSTGKVPCLAYWEDPVGQGEQHDHEGIIGECQNDRD